MSRRMLNELRTFTFRCPRCGHDKAAVYFKCDCCSDTISKAKMNASNDDYELVYDGNLGIGYVESLHFACDKCGEVVRDAKGDPIADERSFARFCKLHGTMGEDE